MRLPQARFFTGLCLLVLAGCATNSSRSTSRRYQISGVLHGTGDSQLPVAQALLSKLGEDASHPLARVAANAGGDFSLMAPGPGDYSLWLSSPGYPTRNVYLQIPPDEQAVSLQATLQPYALVDKPEDLLIVGKWSKNSQGDAEPMKAQPDGTWVFEHAAEGESVTYTIAGIAPGFAMTCVSEDGYEPDAEGSYACRAPVREGRVHIVFDPRKMPRSDAPVPLQVDFAPPFSFLKPINALHARADTLSMLASRQKPGSFDFGSLPEDLLGYARDSRQPTVFRRLAVLEMLGLSGYSFASNHPGEKGAVLAAELLQLLPAREPLWGVSFGSATSIDSLTGFLKPADRHVLLEDFAEHNPDVVVRVYAISLLLDEAQEARDGQRMTLLVEQLKAYQDKHPFASMMLARFNSRSQQKKGQPVPLFSVPLLDGPGNVSRDSLLGRFYLVDFWATWCKGCVKGIPSMEAALEKFKGRGGFTILSVSMDDTLEKVRDFRSGAHKMPWMHVVNGSDYETAMSKAFDVQVLPTLFLVDAQGRIIAQGEALESERLEKTLDKLLPPAAP